MDLKNRYLAKAIQKDALADKKMAFVSGPRQVGKTTLAKRFLTSDRNYHSWDQTEFRRTWVQSPSSIIEGRSQGPVVFDEIHKDRLWKRRIKGLYDVFGDQVSMLITGSARLDLYRKGNDSLLGRYIPYRLHPFSVAESEDPLEPDEILSKTKVTFPWKDLLILGGFPEPLLKGSELKAQRWSRLRLDRLAFEDTRDIRSLSNYNSFRILLDLVPEKVGSLFSYNSLREDVGVAYATVRDWVLISESLYFGFFVRPYSKGIKRSLRAEPKFYLYDLVQIPKEEKGKRLENLVALHLLKACHFWTDVGYGAFDLHFLRDKEKREVDFLITRDKKPWILIECKSKDSAPSKNIVYFSEILKTNLNFQLIDRPSFDRYYPHSKTRVIDYQTFFSGLI